MGGVIFDRTEADLTPADEKDKQDPAAVPVPADQGGGNQPPGQPAGQQPGNQPAEQPAAGNGQQEGESNKGV